MRTAIVSDLHLGVASGEDVLRDPAVRRVLLEEIAGADRLVLLGDVVELRDLPVGPSLERARPFFEELGEALGERRGDARPRQPRPPPRRAAARRALDRRQPAARARAPPRPATGPTAADRRVARAGAAARSPTPASGCARTSTRPTATTWTPTCSCRAPSASPSPPLIRLSGPLPDPATPADYERVLRPIYGFAYGVAQVLPRRPPPPRPLRARLGGARRRTSGDGHARAAARAARAGVPGRRSAASTACSAPTSSADVSAAAIFRTGVEAATEMATPPRGRRRPRDHRPHPPRRPARRAKPSGRSPAAAASTTPAAGSSPPPSTNPGTPPNPYWPGTVTWLEDDGPAAPRSSCCCDRSHEEMIELIDAHGWPTRRARRASDSASRSAEPLGDDRADLRPRVLLEEVRGVRDRPRRREVELAGDPLADREGQDRVGVGPEDQRRPVVLAQGVGDAFALGRADRVGLGRQDQREGARAGLRGGRLYKEPRRRRSPRRPDRSCSRRGPASRPARPRCRGRSRGRRTRRRSSAGGR